MNISIDERWGKFIETSVEDGHYGSASEVVQAGLRLAEEREAKLALVRQQLEQSIASGGDISEAEMSAALDSITAALKQEGY